MANPKDKKKTEKKKRPPFHKVLIDLMTREDIVIIPGFDVSTERWQQISIGATLLCSGDIPEKAIPVVKEAAKAARKESKNVNARAALGNLAKTLEDKKKEKRPPFHKILIDLMTGENIVIIPGFDVSTERWEQISIGATLLCLGHIPPDAIPAVKKAAKAAWKENDNNDADAALENLAEALKFKLSKRRE